ncbi:alpha/beta hydrolase-fold protein [Saprospira sp. CCB-QB6]|uniref:alpha/beta hydrolase n=1 Tax=Saprospira sp. CCB-QB6 TaxID=3023936 RepID=UPI0023490A87|nr:alpha/beta hydrolase-fold protein [Saprospira sp. CCB-QB6]WCL80957.1 alpha/beta hydrolase-fold protein [Saprospira sp. CCB-QB6]
MRAYICLLGLVFFCLLGKGQNLPQNLGETDFVIGETIRLWSDSLGEERRINVYLPGDYDQDSLKQYPVIYLLDGGKEEDFIHISGIVQFGTFSWINMLPASIVVGIENVDRKRDFTYPSENELDQKEFPSSGQSERFIEFIEKELQPFVAASYRTAGDKTLIGQSLGGLLATEILLKKTALFEHYIIVSPSLWWDEERLLSWDMSLAKEATSIYIAVGKEGKVMERTAKTLYKKLRKEGAGKRNLFFEFLPDKTHGDALHQAVYHAFEKIYAAKKKE